MPYSIEWLIEKRVFLLEVQEDVSIGELQSLIDDYKSWTESGIPPVHAFIDATQLADYPKRIRDIRQLLPALNDEQVGWVILISHNTFINLLSSILLRLNQVRFRTYRSRDECLEFLYSRDPSLPLLADSDSSS